MTTHGSCDFCGRLLPAPAPRSTGDATRLYCPLSVSACRQADSARRRMERELAWLSYPDTLAGNLARQARVRALLSDAGTIMGRAERGSPPRKGRGYARPMTGPTCALCGRVVQRSGGKGRPSPYCDPLISPCRVVAATIAEWRSRLGGIHWPATPRGLKVASDIASELRGWAVYIGQR